MLEKTGETRKMMDKHQRKAVAEDTLRILGEGEYTIRIDVKEKVANCVSGTKYYPPETTLGEIGVRYNRYIDGPVLEVCPETTLESARRLCGKHVRVGVLNFASGKNPGGGFLHGAEAQEETIARSSALYWSLTADHCKPYYETNRISRDPRYTDAMIWSPDCPVFRDDDGFLIGDPYVVDIITCAAPNYNDTVQSSKGRERLLRNEMNSLLQIRALKVLQLFAHYDVPVLVLGAWGCGVFGNDPWVVAKIFRHLLTTVFKDRFEKVVFAIPEGHNHEVFMRGILLGEDGPEKDEE